MKKSRSPNGGWLLWALLVMFASASMVSAKPFWLRGLDSNEQDFLPPEVAFRVAAHLREQRLELHWVIADGYYVYRDKIEIEAASPGIIVGTPELPPGVALTDEYFGAQQVYFNEALVTVPLQRGDYGAHPPQVKITYQGCAKAGLCYPPISKVIFPDAVPGQTYQSLGRPAFAAWPAIAISGGLAAFVLAGLLLRKNRQLAVPKP